MEHSKKHKTEIGLNRQISISHWTTIRFSENWVTLSIVIAIVSWNCLDYSDCHLQPIINLGIIPMKIATQTSPIWACMYLAAMTPKKNIKKCEYPYILWHVYTLLYQPPPKKKTPAGLFARDPSTESLLSVWRHNMATLCSPWFSPVLPRMWLGGSS